MENNTSEHQRLREKHSGPVAPWRKWGPYVSERSWGSVREDYSPDGCAWEFLTHDMARSKAYRWGEDGIAGDLRSLSASGLRPRPVEWP